MNLNRVTITGADDSVDPRELIELSKRFPFVEWGILLSASNMSSMRYPSLHWIAKFCDACSESTDHTAISFHVCGRWVRDICAGNWTPLFTNIGPMLDCGRRIQLNFHAYEHLLGERFMSAANDRSKEHDWQLIFQCDGVNDHLVSIAYDFGMNAVPLYDKSGGAGVIPADWPSAMKGIYSGYAGGLGPENLADEIPKIEQAANGGTYWIDMETKVRSDHNRQFDLDKVTRSLEISAPFIDELP